VVDDKAEGARVLQGVATRKDIARVSCFFPMGSFADTGGELYGRCERRAAAKGEGISWYAIVWESFSHPLEGREIGKLYLEAALTTSGR